VKVTGEVRVVMGGERRVHMWSGSDGKKMKKSYNHQLSLYIAA